MACRGSRQVGCAIALLALTVATVACGSSGTAEGAKGSTTVSAATDGEAPTGAPIVVGFISQGDGAYPVPEYAYGAEAAVDYLNRNGGLAGRPIQLEMCSTTTTVETSAKCANELLEKRPVLVIGGLDSKASASTAILAQAGVPYVTSFPTVPEELTCATCVAFNGGVTDIVQALLGGLVDAGVERASIIHLEGAAGQLAADSFKAGAEKVGISVKLVPQPATSPDATVALSAANDSDPDAIVTLSGATHCTSIMRNARPLGVTAALYFAPSCAEPATIEAGGAGAEGAHFSSSFRSFDDEADPEVALFRAAMAESAPDSEVFFAPQTTFSTLMTLAVVFEGLEGADITAPSVLAALKAASGVPIFMGIGGAELHCDGTLSPKLPAVCSTTGGVLLYEDGIFTEV